MRTPRPSTVLVGLCLALAAPAVAHAAPSKPGKKAGKKSTAKKLIKDAKKSPFYKRSMTRAEIKPNGLEKVTVANGTTMNFLKYVKGSALDTRPEFAPLFQPGMPAGVLDGSPAYTEVIHELEDRLVIERTITVPLADGACDKPAKLPKAVRGLCFRKTGKGKKSKALVKELTDIRAKLAAADPAKIVKGSVTVDQAAKMDDTQLLGLLLNHDDRKIRHVSIVPRIVPNQGTTVDTLDIKLDPNAAELSPAPSGGSKSPKRPKHIAFPVSGKTFDTKYFLTGFTFGRQFSDTWEYTIAGETWLTDRYYIKFEYLLSLGFGVRAPFSVDVKSAGNSDGGVDVEMSVDPIETDDNGLPAYPAVGLPESKYFNGKEFVLEAYATCGLYISIPGPNVDENCPTFGKNYSREIKPVIGTETSNIKDWWLEGKDTGLGLSIGVAGAYIDLGIGADVTNGRVGMDVEPLVSSSIVGVTNNRVSFSNRNPFTFKVNRSTSTSDAGFALTKPRYGFAIRMAPKVRVALEVDVAIYENDWILGPWTIDQLGVAVGFDLPHHAGTVDRHEYKVFGSNPINDAVLDPNAGDPPPPPPKVWHGQKLPGTAGMAQD